MNTEGKYTISIKEYDIVDASKFVPGQISHIGIVFSDDIDREINFGSFINGNYNPVGGFFDRSDILGGFQGKLGLPYTIVDQITVTPEQGRALYDQVTQFKDDLAEARVEYSLTPGLTPGIFGFDANSNSAAAHVMGILGIDPATVSFKGIPVGINVSLQGIKGIKDVSEYQRSAREAYEQQTRMPAELPIPTPRPSPKSSPTTVPLPQPEPTDKLNAHEKTQAPGLPGGLLAEESLANAFGDVQNTRETVGNGPFPNSIERALSGPIVNTPELIEPDWNTGSFRDALPSEDLGTFSKPPSDASSVLDVQNGRKIDSDGPFPTLIGRVLSGSIINTPELTAPEFGKDVFHDAVPAENLSTFSKSPSGTRTPSIKESNFGFSVVPSADPINYVPGETLGSPVPGYGIPGVFDPAMQRSAIVDPISREMSGTAISTFNGSLGRPSLDVAAMGAAPADNAVGALAGSANEQLGFESPGVLAGAVGGLNRARSVMSGVPASAVAAGTQSMAPQSESVLSRTVEVAPLAPAVEVQPTAGLARSLNVQNALARALPQSQIGIPTAAAAIAPNLTQAAPSTAMTPGRLAGGILSRVVEGLAQHAQQGGLLSSPLSGMQAPGQWMGGNFAQNDAFSTNSGAAIDPNTGWQSFTNQHGVTTLTGGLKAFPDDAQPMVSNAGLGGGVGPGKG